MFPTFGDKSHEFNDKSVAIITIVSNIVQQWNTYQLLYSYQ